MARRWITTCTCDYSTRTDGTWGIVQVRHHCPHHGTTEHRGDFTSAHIEDLAS